MLEIKVHHSATVYLEQDSSMVTLYTVFWKDRWEWFGYLSNIVGHDANGGRIYESVCPVDCGEIRFDSSVQAIEHGVSQLSEESEG